MLPVVHFSVLVAMLLSGGEPGLRGVDFESRFGKFEGCFIIKELGQDWTLRYNEAACAKRFSPCSTFKVFSSLAALDCGAIAGPDTLIKWDGKPKRMKGWERDHTLASAIKESCVWYFQEVARRIGPERMKKYLAACDYGNQDISGGIDQFWLERSLVISAEEQARFMEALYSNRLPFKKEVMETVRGLLVLKQGKNWAFSGKTGTGAKDGDNANLGWFVGHVRSGDRQYVFAINIQAHDGALGRAAKEIVFGLLKDFGIVEEGT